MRYCRELRVRSRFAHVRHIFIDSGLGYTSLSPQSPLPLPGVQSLTATPQSSTATPRAGRFKAEDGDWVEDASKTLIRDGETVRTAKHLMREIGGSENHQRDDS